MSNYVVERNVNPAVPPQTVWNTVYGDSNCLDAIRRDFHIPEQTIHPSQVVSCDTIEKIKQVNAEFPCARGKTYDARRDIEWVESGAPYLGGTVYYYTNVGTVNPFSHRQNFHEGGKTTFECYVDPMGRRVPHWNFTPAKTPCFETPLTSIIDTDWQRQDIMASYESQLNEHSWNVNLGFGYLNPQVQCNSRPFNQGAHPSPKCTL